jgi:hypothetical protein
MDKRVYFFDFKGQGAAKIAAFLKKIDDSQNYSNNGLVSCLVDSIDVERNVNSTNNVMAFLKKSKHTLVHSNKKVVFITVTLVGNTPVYNVETSEFKRIGNSVYVFGTGSTRNRLIKELGPVVWLGASKSPSVAQGNFPYHFIFMVSDAILQRKREVFETSQLPIMRGDDKHAMFFKTDIPAGDKNTSVRISLPVFEYLLGPTLHTNNQFHGNTNFRNKVRDMLRSNAGSSQPKPSRPRSTNARRNNTTGTPLSKKLKTNHTVNLRNKIFFGKLDYNNDEYKYVFYPKGIKVIDPIITMASKMNAKAVDYTTVAGHHIVRMGPVPMVLLPAPGNEHIKFPRHMVPMVVSPLM